MVTLMLAKYIAKPPFSSNLSGNCIVISGFNTDVKFDDVVYHIQTEDKGLKSRLIVSLVYDRGTILASRRSSYEDIANETLDENVLAERLQKQHKLICAAVKAGRINDLKAMTDDIGKKPSSEKAEQVTEVQAAYEPIVNKPQPIGVVDLHTVVTYSSPASADELSPTPISMPDDGAISSLDLEILDDGPIFDAVCIVEEETVLDAEAVAVVSELSGTDRPTHNKLSLELLGETKFKGGDRSTVNIMVCRGTTRKVVTDAQIMIKVLGSSFRPLIFHAKTDQNGLAKVHLQLPHFQAGRAAVLIRAISSGEELELRRIVTPG
ncbi:MAG: hypothetical protein IPL32_05185 [Chloracidobacterium sp.]|nr:hypothetical protein [Chloracidobacterium sp.]